MIKSAAKPQIVNRMLSCQDIGAADEVLAGLLAQPRRWINTKFLYDTMGCHLFKAICASPEYYVTRTEERIFNENRQQISKALGSGRQLIDIGAGDCEKAAQWFANLKPKRYIAIDVAHDVLETSLNRMAANGPEVELLGLIEDYSQGFVIDGIATAEPRTFFYPGTSIGNFVPDEALRLLRDLRAHCTTGESGLLVCVDLVKDRDTLLRAYDDATGVMAAFNKNVLNVLNRTLQGDFDPRDFRHVACFDDDASRIEMHLEAVRNISVSLDGQALKLAAGERIHTASSHKYTVRGFESLLCTAGFTRLTHWTDALGWYGVFFAQP